MLKGRKKPPFSPLIRNLLRLPNRPGAYLQSTDTDVLLIEQPIGFKVQNDMHALQIKDELALWLITEEAVPLQFDDEPGRTYFAVVQNTLEDFEKIVDLRKGTIQFLCLDPYGYGNERTFIKAAGTEETNIVVLNNPGTVKSYPNFKFTVKKNITHLDILSDEAHMRIGMPATIEDTVISPTDVILSDSMNTLVGWANASQVDGGIVAGSFMTGSEGFQVDSFGSGEAWHGPSLQKSISQPLKDFQVEMRCKFFSMNHAGVGRIELYLLDANGTRFAKLAFKDIHRYNYLQQGEARVGPHIGGTFIIAGSPPNPKQWDYFTGILRLSRRNGKWEAYIANIDGVHIGVMEATRIDESVNADLAGIQIHAGVSGTNSPATMRIQQIRVLKLNDVSGSKIPFIAKPGDEISIDHKAKSIRINGEDKIKLKDFGSSYFPIKRGDTALMVIPGDAVDIEAKVRGVYH